MTSYMYNPSKKITELLSQYLEFDPEQLQLGIWSGNLTLTDVQLRQEAIYPLLNQFWTGGGDSGADAENNNTASSDNHKSNSNRGTDGFAKPPLRFKLVSGKIGYLSLKIPWKRLVWGQGDVQMEIRNVVMVLALESRDETEARSSAGNPATSPNTSMYEKLFPSLPTDQDAASRGNSNGDFSNHSDPDFIGADSDDDSVTARAAAVIRRERKQKRLREAERRHLQGKDLGPWLEAVKKKDAGEMAKSIRVRGDSLAGAVGRTGNVERWFKSTTNDFFWRFCAGLQMKLENLKIVMIQDGIEVGLMMPSTQVLAGTPDQRSSIKITAVRTNSNGNMINEEGSVIDFSEGTPPHNLAYEGEYEDGEHIDKLIKFLGICIFVRKASSKQTPSSAGLDQSNLASAAAAASNVQLDVSTREYVLRPVAVDFSFSLFFPCPPERRKKRRQAQDNHNSQQLTPPPPPQQLQQQQQQHQQQQMTDGNNDASVSSAKRRRDKREKRPLNYSNESTTEMTELTSMQSAAAAAAIQISASPEQNRGGNNAALSFHGGTPAPPRRMNSIGATRGSTAADKIRRSSFVRAAGPPRHPRLGNPAMLPPLLQPDDLGSVFAAASVGGDITPRYDGRLSIGAIQFVCSNRHYELIKTFLAAGAKMRNGRPTRTIHSVLHHGQEMRRSLTVIAPPSIAKDLQNTARSGGNVTVRLELHSARTERSDVVRSWWVYILGSIMWELRQRRKLRRSFQEKFLSFSWNRQRHKRQEYVNLYIVTHLQGGSVSSEAGTTKKSREAQLLKIEDELPVEQILLYRSLARAVHVRGQTEMPSTILDLRGGIRHSPLDIRAEVGTSATGQVPLDPKGRRSSGVYGDTMQAEPDDETTYLSMIEARCELARERRDCKDRELPPYQPHVAWPQFLDVGAYTFDLDETSRGMFTDSRSVVSYRTNRYGVASALEAVAAREEEASARAMLFSFAVKVEKLELMIVEEELFTDGFEDMKQEEELSGTEREASEVSVLTDDQRFFHDDEGLLEIGDDESLVADPIMSSTDYLLFKVPEKILLHVVLTPLSFSAQGKGMISRNVDFVIGEISVIGVSGDSLLGMGRMETEMAPLQEVQFSDGRERYTGGVSQYDAPQNAFSFSFVNTDDDNLIQLDASTIRACYDTKTFSKMSLFLRYDSVLFPSQLLPRSAREEVRLYVLHQNDRPDLRPFNCSVRFHGFEILLPVESKEPSSVEEVTWSSSNGSSDSSEAGGRLRCGMIEMYSGTSVNALFSKSDWHQPDVMQAGPEKPLSLMERVGMEVTRRLRMLDVGDLLAARGSIMCHHWVATASGVDVLFSKASNESKPMSFLDRPVDAELLFIANEDSVLDFNRSQREVVVAVSPILISLSETRLQRLSAVIPQPTSNPKSPIAPVVDEELPPRLEVLSPLMLYSVNVSLDRIRLSFIGGEERRTPRPILTKHLEMEDSVNDFISVVSCFDLSFPHEEALSSAMQICIDRLAGLGLPLEESWEATNRALLNFLEDVAEARRENTEDGEAASGPEIREEQFQKILQDTRKRSVERTVAGYVDRLESDKDDTRVAQDIVIDVSDGFEFSFVQLFYDQYMEVDIPAIFVANGGGTHMLRATPPDKSTQGDDSHSSRSESTQQVQSGLGGSMSDVESLSGIGLRRFVVDKQHSYGKGGLNLAALGTDVDEGGDVSTRTREILTDVDLGDVEIMFSQSLAAAALKTLSQVISPFRDSTSIFDKTTSAKPSSHRGVDDHSMMAVRSLSALFVSDNLSPFTRVTAQQIVARDFDRRYHLPSGVTRGMHMTSKTFDFLNLSPGGELYPHTITMLPNPRDATMKVRCQKSGGSTIIDVELHGIRFVILRQFLNDFIQYFASGDYGFGLLMKQLLDESDFDQGSQSSVECKVTLLDSSVILPRSSASSEMLAIELDKASFYSCAPTESFVMPSPSKPLQTETGSGAKTSWHLRSDDDQVENFEDAFQDSSSESANNCSRATVSRTVIELRDFRIYTALSSGDTVDSIESPSFRFLYAISGHASSGKQVYYPLAGEETHTAEYEAVQSHTEKTRRCWRDVTMESVSLDIFVDYAPHLRLLITDPLDGMANRVGLSMSLSQFSMILSVWYSNMQELPAMFPYSASQLEDGARWVFFGKDFPELGTEDFVNKLKYPTSFSSETAINIRNLAARFSFERQDERDVGANDALSLEFARAIIHITSDDDGVTRIGAACSKAALRDESRLYRDVLLVEKPSHHNHCWVDLSFGLDREYESLVEELPQAFQLSVFMTSKSTIYNLGMANAMIALSDFLPIYRLLEFLDAYFSDASLGNPSFEAAERARKIKSELRRTSTSGESDESDPVQASCIDFRLWLSRPCLCVPCDPLESTSAGLRILSDHGLWYKYTAVGEFSSQECISSRLSLVFDDKCAAGRLQSDSESAGRALIENLSLGFRLDFNVALNHTDMSIQIPLTNFQACGLTSSRMSAVPSTVDVPTICVPYVQPNRFLGPKICEITCIIEVLPLTWSSLVNLFTAAPETADTDEMQLNEGPKSKKGDSSVTTAQSGNGETTSTTDDSSEADGGTFSLVVTAGDIRLFALDPVLGPHLPVAVVSVSSFTVTASQFHDSNERVEVSGGESPPEDLQVFVESHFWADYFKLGLTRSWEPLVEAYRFSMLCEKSRYRGNGVSFNSDSPLHINISGALLVILDEVVDVFQRLIRDTFGSDSSPYKTTDNTPAVPNMKDRYLLRDVLDDKDFVHEMPRPLDHGDRVAFSLRNMTGQKIRVYRPEVDISSTGHCVAITYLDQFQTAKLSFQPSISMIKNMRVVEVPYPGLPKSQQEMSEEQTIPPHLVDVQLPGFCWLQEIEVDTFGRGFATIKPRSFELQLKVSEDWRLENVMKVLVEVGLENGGRQVTIFSLFSVVNKTNHDLEVLAHPDPSFQPKDLLRHCAEGENRVVSGDVEAVAPGSSHQVPTLLLESSLRQPGSHLGSLWIKPGLRTCDPDGLKSFHGEGVEESKGLTVNFSSRPVQLAKLVSESALLFDNARGQDIGSDSAKSGVQVSCPVVQDSGDRLAPFCYAVEIGRSPLVRARSGKEESQRKKRKVVHGPVAYCLSVYPPFVIVNLLPEKGRFELMHAVRRTVLWFADLEPGQQISVHSVGLDAPLLLLLNLGFCRTPVGEGALVHHGADLAPGSRESLGGLKSIGKAGKAVTQQLGRKLTSISDSPEKRVAHARGHSTKGRTAEGNVDLGLDTGVSGIESVDGKTYRIDTTVFYPDDVADETTIVDSLGQRLTLNLENVRGGGGQRRISVFCRFWIVNTTEHALRYKQENCKNFVCGTVLDPSTDGSTPLNAGRSRAKYKGVEEGSDAKSNAPQTHSEGTVFSGTHGALATSPGSCELSSKQVAELIDKNLSVEKLAQLAFMFNFHEGVVSMGNQRLCVQLGDGTGSSRYLSDWSRGFSLDSVGFTQVIAIHCKDGRALELMVVVTVAPGLLNRYTKIVRFLPRYVVLNTLQYPVRLWQDSSVFRPLYSDESADANASNPKWRYARDRARKNYNKISQYEALWGREAVLDERDRSRMTVGTTAHRSALYINTVSTSELVPFSLPDTRVDRQLRVDVGAPWNLTASFSADVPGEHTLKINRAVDLMVLPHIQTRASRDYEVRVTPHSVNFTTELGVWFETEWGSSRSVIVKAVKKNSFAFNETDIHVGDELLCLDRIPVSRMTFTEAMASLRSRLNEISSRRPKEPRRAVRRASLRLALPRASQEIQGEGGSIVDPLILSFRTVEERLRRVRLKAAKAQSAAQNRSVRSSSGRWRVGTDIIGAALVDHTNTYIKAELRTIHHSLFLVLREDTAVPFQIHNRTINSTIYYRQKGCEGHSWQSLKPGQSDSYSWEEPMKPKRLTVRVATESAHNFVTELAEANQEDCPLSSSRRSGGNSSTAEDLKTRRRLRKVNDEEDEIFSQSVVVRLEEIGFREYLPCPASGKDGQKRYLELEVDVVGATRVLVVHDVSGEGGAHQMTRHLESLGTRIAEEGQRLTNLQVLNSVVLRATGKRSSKGDTGKSVYDVVDDAQRLMEDFSEENIITKRHQIVVEVLEAIGLSAQAFAGYSNPYAEVSLESGTGGRTSLFKKNKNVRRTYYVRKTINPTWNAQSFIFDVPAEAVSVTRGYAVKVRLRNFRVLGYHQSLGRALVDLHSVRNQEPLIGWFPLSGSTGRRELENHLSHWGRGSVKLRVQWVYSIPALLQYFILNSEKRLFDLQSRREGMEQQLENKKKADDKKKEAIDGFKAVRVNDLLAFSKSRHEFMSLPFVRTKSTGNAIKRGELLRNGMEHVRRQQVTWPPPTEGNLRSYDRLIRVKRQISSPRFDVSTHKRSGFSSQRALDSFSYLEDKISQQRQNFQEVLSSTFLPERRTILVLQPGYSGEFSVSSFKSWTAAEALFNDPDLDIEIHDETIKTRLSNRTMNKPEIPDIGSTSSQRVVAQKLIMPPSSPVALASSAQNYAAEFLRSRVSFERAARRSLRTILNPGGWLTIRPITALNLPDTFTGMFVKLRYGAETLTSETTDARVCPVWYQPSRGNERVNCESNETDSVFMSNADEDESNDLHIHVAPQKTSGSIRISVMGERSHQQLTAKVELGVLHLPLGAAIAACIDSADNNEDHSPVYVRWFPLMSPRDAVPVEGDGGVSLRPPDTEKTGDHLFQEYFAPCIQLALLWLPESEGERNLEHSANMSLVPIDVSLPEIDGQGTGLSENDEEGVSPVMNEGNGRPDNNLQGLSGTASPVVSSYFCADIGRISAALIESQRAFELVSFTMLDIDVRYWVTRAKTRMGLSVGWVQLDHQAEGAREPVMLAPTPSDCLVPVIQTLAVKDNIRSRTEILSFDFIDVSIAEFDITIEEIFLFDLFGFFHAISLRKGVKHRATAGWEGSHTHSIRSEQHFLTAEDVEVEEPTLVSQLDDGLRNETRRNKKVYIEQLFLGVVKINLSYLKGKRTPWELTSQGGWVDKRIDGVQALQQIAMAGGEHIMRTFTFHHEKSNVFLGWSQHTSEEDREAEDGGKGWQNLPSLLANLFPNVSDAPVRLPGKALNHVFECPTEILESIRKYYVHETLKQIYKIIGSLDFVGNPTMLFTSFFSGVRDLVLAPSVAFLRSPTDPSQVGLGVATGTLSLLSHSVSGFFGFFAKVSAATGQAVATLSLDSDFRGWHRDKIVVEATNLNREWKRRGMQSAQAMIARPIGDILLGIGGGVTGVVIAPIKGYRRNGGVGLIQGVALGGLGVVAKPVVGVLDAFAHFTASVHDIAKSVNVLDRRLQPALKLRLPYIFGANNILVSFDATTARATYLLNLYPIGRGRSSFSSSEESLIHAEVLPNIGTDTFAIATSVRVVLIRMLKESSGALSPTLCWEVDLRGEPVISSRVYDHGHNGVALTITVTKPADSDEADNSSVKQSVSAVDSPLRASATEQGDVSVDQGEISCRIDCAPAQEPEPSVEQGATVDTHEQGQAAQHAGSQTMIGLSSPEESLPAVSAGEDFTHSTGRGVKGELLEWFTVLAEYQYRRQLARLHNAISCIVGDFGAIMRDRSLGRPGSDEGYTSFGIYQFDSNRLGESVHSRKDNRTLSKLEDLPWISKSSFRAAHKLTPGEQQRHLLELREQWSYLKLLDDVRKEGGPEWLVVAQAQAMFVDDNAPRTPFSTRAARRRSGSSGSTRRGESLGSRGPRRRTRWLNQFSLPTSRDSGDSAESASDNDGPIRGPSLSRYLSGRQVVANVSFGNGTSSSIHRPASVDRSQAVDAPVQRVRCDASALTDDGFDVGNQVVGRDLSDSSAPTFRSASTDLPPPLFNSPLGREDATCDSLDGSELLPTLEEEEGNLSGDEATPLESVALEHEEATPALEAQQGATSRASHEGSWATTAVDEQKHRASDESMAQSMHSTARSAQTMQSAHSSVQRNDRLDRMEQLMERLLIFSTEQTLQHQRSPLALPAAPPLAAGNVVGRRGETDELKREIASLNQQLSSHLAGSNEQVVQSSQDDFSALRQEISSLREQLKGLTSSR